MPNVIKYDPKLTKLASDLFNSVRDDFSAAAFKLKIILDKELYLVAGYESFQECCEIEFGMKKSAAYSQLKIADKFLLKAPDCSIPDESITLESLKLPPIPVEKLKILSQLPSEQTQRLVTEGKITIRGKEYTVEDINKMDRDQLRKTIKGNKPITYREETDTYPFSIVYKMVQQYLTKLLETTYKCDEMTQEQMEQVYAKAKELGDLYDQIKSS